MYGFTSKLLLQPAQRSFALALALIRINQLTEGTERGCQAETLLDQFCFRTATSAGMMPCQDLTYFNFQVSTGAEIF